MWYVVSICIPHTTYHIPFSHFDPTAPLSQLDPKPPVAAPLLSRVFPDLDLYQLIQFLSWILAHVSSSRMSRSSSHPWKPAVSKHPISISDAPVCPALS